MSTKSTIKWAEFSTKHKKYIAKALEVQMSVAEGAVRSGKTIDHCLIASIFLETCEDKFHLASGSTLANAKLNIGTCNGFGLEFLFRGRCRWGKYRSNEALYIQTKTGEKIVIFTGGGKADSYKSILGNSFGLWIATEINEHYDCENSRESFIKVAMARQIAALQPKTLWDLNPCNPKDPIYTSYIDKYESHPPSDGYQLQNFTLADNLSLPADRMQAIVDKYTKGTVWFRRDILGERCVVEGLIYKYFADNTETFMTDSPDYDFINVGIDFGGSGSGHSFVATGLKNDMTSVAVLYSRRVNAHETTSDDLLDWIENNVIAVENKYGCIDSVYADSAEQVLKNSIAERLPRLNVRNSIKNKIIERIRTGCMLMARHQISFTDDCESIISALCECIWNPKSKLVDERLDDGTTDIDSIDAYEYSWEKYIKRLGV